MSSIHYATAAVVPYGTRSRQKLIDRIPRIVSGKSVKLVKAIIGSTNHQAAAVVCTFRCINDDPNRIPHDVRNAVRRAMGSTDVSVEVIVHQDIIYSDPE